MVTAILAVSPNPRNTPVSDVFVTFNEPINTGELSSTALTLTVNGATVAPIGFGSNPCCG